MYKYDESKSDIHNIALALYDIANAIESKEIKMPFPAPAPDLSELDKLQSAIDKFKGFKVPTV